jgi:hypothetical protein
MYIGVLVAEISFLVKGHASICKRIDHSNPFVLEEETSESKNITKYSKYDRDEDINLNKYYSDISILKNGILQYDDNSETIHKGDNDDILIGRKNPNHASLPNIYSNDILRGKTNVFVFKKFRRIMIRHYISRSFLFFNYAPIGTVCVYVGHVRRFCSPLPVVIFT